MRVFVALLILAAAVWRAGVDWQATIGEGYAFRPASVGQVIAGMWPEDYASFVERLHQSGIPYAWDPLGALFMSLPLALVLVALSLLVWISRSISMR